jgi:hypothetical protein
MEAEKLALERVHNRIGSTPNEDLAKVLEKLLPGLIPLSNRPELQPQVVTIISNITRRMKSLQTSLSCSQLLVKLVSPDMLPFACNIAITVIDISIDYIPSSDRELCALAIIECLDRFGNEYSSQVNSLLNYALKFLPELSLVMKNNQISDRFQRVLSSWLLDIVLIQPGLKRDGVGSIQPGLSKERVSRLTSKVESWEYAPLKELKLTLLQHVDISWVNPSCVMAIFAICACDTISDVAKQGVYKLNSLKTAIQQSHVPLHPILISLLHLCLIGYEEGPIVGLSQLELSWRGWTINDSLQYALSFDSRTAAIPGLDYRTPLREDILIQILQWIYQEALSSSAGAEVPLDQIDGLSVSVLQLIRRYSSLPNEFRSSASISPKLLATSLELGSTWLQRSVSLADLSQGVTILQRTCVRALSRYLKTQNAVTSNFGQEEVDLMIKRVCSPPSPSPVSLMTLP